MKDGPSEHLSWDELACHDADKTPYPEKWRTTRAVDLATEFEAVRALVGAPIKVGSAYRTLEYNRTIPGSAKNSQHPEGRALDLYPPKGWTVDRFYAVIRQRALMSESKIYGLGRYKTFVHMDVRPAPKGERLVAWQGSRAWAEPKSPPPGVVTT